jgi:hypothetical protein
MSLFTKEVVEGFYMDLFAGYGRDVVDKLFTNFADEKKKLRIMTKTDIDSSKKYKNQFVQRKGSVCEEYLEPYMQNTLSAKDLEVDYALIIEDTPRGRLYAILIAQKGECTGKPDIWNVRLVCNRSGERTVGYGGNASKLLGLFVYALNHGDHDYGMLEVADGHNNVGAYCAYSRYGFQETPLAECDEFTDGNIAMFIEMDFIGSSKLERTNKILASVVDRNVNVKDGTDEIKYCKTLRQQGVIVPEIVPEIQPEIVPEINNTTGCSIQ